MKYLLTVQIEKHILHLSISHGNELLCSAKMCCIRSVQCSRLAISAWPVTTLSQSWNVKH